MSTIELQIEREKGMAERGARRAQAAIERALERGEAGETPAGVQTIKRSVEPIAKAIREFCDTSLNGGPGRRATAAVKLAGISPEVAAYTALRCALTGASRRSSIRSVAYAIGNHLADEVMAEEFEAENEALYFSVIRNAQTRGLTISRVAAAVREANRKFGVVERWTTNDRVQVGMKLLELSIVHTTLFHEKFLRVGKRTLHILEFASGMDEWFRDYNNATMLSRPMFLPCVIPPKKWEALEGGAYYTGLSRGSAIVRRPMRGQLDILRNADLSRVYKGINGLQETAWRVNGRVLVVMQEAWDRNLDLPCLPNREDIPIPLAPQEVVDDVRGGVQRKAWRRKLRAIHEANAASRSTRFEFARCLAIAQDHQDFPAIYFPHHVDFRGRAYATTTSLNPQGSDNAKGLLEFADGKPLGERGLFWLGVHGANLFGNDKVSLGERYSWAVEHVAEVRCVARDPLYHRWWMEADKPWSFLAWCYEWSDVWEPGTKGPREDYVSHLPVALDGSCNGIQHYSAILRDEVGGKAVNLVPGDKPQDIYQEVADRVMHRLRTYTDDPAKVWMAEAWERLGVGRKITKRPVMVLPYGGTFKSCRTYVEAAAKEKIAASGSDPFGAETSAAMNFLASLVWASIGDVVVAARQGMAWLQAVARLASAEALPLTWTTPSGFVVRQEYRDMSTAQIRTRFMGKTIVFRSVDDGPNIAVSRQAQALPPNFIHSYDAAALMLTVGRLLDAGLRHFAMIHDSYAVHAADTDRLALTLRAVFVDMYSGRDVFADFYKDQVAGGLTAHCPPIPALGTLKLEDILKSPYFFA